MNFELDLVNGLSKAMRHATTLVAHALLFELDLATLLSERARDAAPGEEAV